MSQASLITNSAARARGLAQALLKDVDPQRAARLAQGANGPIDANHPTFVYGHLSLYHPMLITMLGQDPGDAAVPDTYDALFNRTAQCIDDPDASKYPPLEEVVEHFMRGSEAAQNAVSNASDEAFATPTPNEKYRAIFPTVGDMANFLLNDHVMFHLGQVSTWRRCEGLGHAM
ncbi:MAG: DinB family protein [Phycisphaerales bacterium JB063]